MKTMMRLVLAGMLVILATPSYSGEAWHAYTCSILDDGTEDDVVAAASKWLKAAKGMKGGEQLELYVFFPVAAQMGETDFRLLLKAPSLKTWGVFWDGYKDSPADKLDAAANAKLECPDSRLFEAVKIE